MNLRKLFYLLLIIPIIFVGCSKDEGTPTDPVPTVNEAQVLVEYLEANGDFLNTGAPAVITAADLRTAQLAGKAYIIDMRSATDFQTKGHIEGAKNVAIKDVVAHVKGINASSYEKIVITCYSGQTAGLPVALLRLLGYNNVFSLKWGMSSWNSSSCTSWSMAAVGNNYPTFQTTANPKPAAGSLPTINTGKKTGKEILEERINQILASADPFGDIRVLHSTVTGGLSNYFILNYWPAADYNKGHLPGAIQYTPKADLKLSTFLKTLPTNKPIAFYCYTGQTSAQVATILKLIGYDAKTLMFGVNVLNYDFMGTNGISNQWKQTEVKEYPVVTGS
ncbi:MAG: rhodanese-like domain-containing protein [Melioribacteraceae bacterium]|jgi:rhodanese-related sulfurtransferase|nr:rhodanese-like domain-containing protein [Melioribacteraceae bacterium]